MAGNYTGATFDRSEAFLSGHRRCSPTHRPGYPDADSRASTLARLLILLPLPVTLHAAAQTAAGPSVAPADSTSVPIELPDVGPSSG